MSHPIAFFEITSGDCARRQSFYTRLFGWNANPDPAMGGYALVETGGRGSNRWGIGPSPVTPMPGVTLYVRVEDLDCSLAAAECLGGRRILSPTKSANRAGTVALFNDPDGNRIGLWAA